MKTESEKPKVVLDTKPIIKLFAQEEGWSEIQKILFKIEAEEIEAAISVVTLTEIYYKYMQEKRQDLARTRVEELTYALYLKKLDVSQSVAIKAGEFKGKYGVSIADAFIAATAYFEGATVISDDPDFKKIPEIKTATEREFSMSLVK
ncbi:MAG: tRNA(fMet)-specific endonuclease VapC [Candidatus Bathyarchaeota archaeon BA2]|nr:MAG: tRNA(fMet)-specific endonuclease VapC [Candidatus Bathyarchaeota archaeon BA2]